MKKKILIITTILSSNFQSGFSLDYDEGDNLYLYTKSTTEATIYSLDEIKKITFSKNGVQIWNTNWPTEYKYNNVRVLTFKEKYSSSSISNYLFNKEENGISIVYKANDCSLSITSKQTMNGMELYNTEGLRVASESLSSQSYHLLLSWLPEGVYIVKVYSNAGAVSKKIIK